MHNPAEHSDHELLLLIAKDDEDAYSRLYERYAPKVYNIAFIYLPDSLKSVVPYARNVPTITQV